MWGISDVTLFWRGRAWASLPFSLVWQCQLSLQASVAVSVAVRNVSYNYAGHCSLCVVCLIHTEFCLEHEPVHTILSADWPCIAGEASHGVLLPLMKTLRFWLCDFLNELKLQSGEVPVGLMPCQIIQPQAPTKWAIYLFIACPQSLFSGFSLSSIFKGSENHELCQNLIRTKNISWFEILSTGHCFPKVPANFSTCSVVIPCYILAATSCEWLTGEQSTV